jgi:hypothetical protein
MIDGRIGVGLAVGALLGVAAWQHRAAGPTGPRRWYHATRAENVSSIQRDGVVRPGRKPPSANLLQNPVRFLEPYVALAPRPDVGDQIDDLLAPAFPGYAYATSQRRVLEHHVPTDRFVIEVKPERGRMWPDEDFVGPAVVAAVHGGDTGYLNSVFRPYFEEGVSASDVLAYGRSVCPLLPRGITRAAGQISMDAYGRYPLQIAIGLAIFSVALRDRKLGDAVREGLPLTSSIAHEGPMRVISVQDER